MDEEEMERRLALGEEPLGLSIEKWQNIVDGVGIDKGGCNCALCFVYRVYGTGCGTCPVCIKTGLLYCHGTPYGSYSNAVIEKNEEDKKKYALEMLEFLKSLKEEKKVD